MTRADTINIVPSTMSGRPVTAPKVVRTVSIPSVSAHGVRIGVSRGQTPDGARMMTAPRVWRVSWWGVQLIST